MSDDAEIEHAGGIAVLAAAPGAREIAPRDAAIRSAIADLASGDVLVIAGKGHERGQIIGDTTLPFDDLEQAQAALGISAHEGAA